MADRQISQLVLQVDANIAVAQRELANLARLVRQNTGDINNALDSTSVHSYAAGASPLRILTLEMGRLAEAATFLGGSGGGGILGKLAGFMSGGWGIAVLLGVNVLAQLIAKHHETGQSIDELVEKMRK